MVDNSRIIEDGKEYLVIDKIKASNGYYVYLSNIEDNSDFFVRKEVERDNGTFLIGLKDEEEVDNALKLFMEKHQND